MKKLKVGDKVRCKEDGSWVNNREGTITALNVISSDNIRGHSILISGDNGGYTVVPSYSLELVEGN